MQGTTQRFFGLDRVNEGNGKLTPTGEIIKVGAP
jgi:hypothetical protein